MKTTTDCIGIREYLLRRGLQPHRETATHGMFLSPLRKERTPSFSVRYDKGLWYDFGLGEGGTLLQLVMRLEGCGMAEAIQHLRKGSADEVPFQPLPTALTREDSPLRILGVGEIRHPALIGYLRERGIDLAVAGALCREVHYAVGERRFFAIGFRNDAGGWELRSRSRVRRPASSLSRKVWIVAWRARNGRARGRFTTELSTAVSTAGSGSCCSVR